MLLSPHRHQYMFSDNSTSEELQATPLWTTKRNKTSKTRLNILFWNSFGLNVLLKNEKHSFQLNFSRYEQLSYAIKNDA